MALPREQYAFLSSTIYDPLVVGKNIHSDVHEYEVLYVSPPSATNYRGAVFRDVETKQLVVANMGTDFGNIHDVLSDVGMGAMGAPTQWPEAAQTMRWAMGYAKDHSVPPSNISATGHSLGGAHAQLQAAMFGVHAETFNAYGAATMAERLGLDVEAAQSLVVNHRMFHDPVSALAEPVGRTVEYMDAGDYHRHCRGGLAMAGEVTEVATAHFMTNFWDKGHNQPAAVFAHNYMDDLRHRPLDDLPLGVPLDLSAPWPSLGERQSVSHGTLAAHASANDIFDHMCTAMQSGDNSDFRQALQQTGDTEFSRAFHAQAAERVDAQDHLASLEAQLALANQQQSAQQVSAPHIGMSL